MSGKKYRYVGIDPSVSSTGLVILDKDGQVIEATSFRGSDDDDPTRFIKLWKRIRKHINPSTDKVLIEGFSLGSRGRSVSIMFGVGWCFRIMMDLEHIPWQEVPPTSLKKFASNKGNAKKEELVLPVYKKWGFESDVNDIVDAYVLARMAWSMYNHDSLLSYEKEVLKKIKKV